MTLRELIAAHPSLFYAQTWYECEAFMDREHSVPTKSLEGVTFRLSADSRGLGWHPFVVEYAYWYVQDPAHPLWTHYLWCAETDAKGQRVYVGQNGKGFEIHRHLDLTERWGIPVWR